MTANVIGHATLGLLPRSTGLGSAISGELGPVGKASGGRIGGGIFGAASRALAPLAGLVAGVASIGAVAAWGKDQVASLARIEQVNAQTANVVRSTGNAAGVTAEGVEALAGHLECVTATEAESIQEGANLLLTFKNIRNGVGAGNDIFDQSVVAMTDMARAMGTDAKGGAVQLGKALNDPIAGISALSRIGVSLTEDQTTLIKTLTESGQIAEAQKIILAELNSQFGGSGAAYAATYAGQVELLAHAWGTFGETLFASAMPALASAVGFLTSAVNIATGLVDNLFNGNTGSELAAMLGVAEGSSVIDLLGGIREGVAGLFAGDFAGALAGLATIRDALITTLAGGVPGILTTLVGFAPALLSAAVGAFSALLAALVAVLPPLYAAFLDMVPTIYTVLLGMVPVYLDAGLQLWGGLVTAIALVLPQVVAALLDFYPVYAAAILGMLPAIVEAGFVLFSGLAQAVVEFAPALITTLLGCLPALVLSLASMVPRIVVTGVELFLSLVLAIVRALPGIITTVVGILPSLVSTLVGMVPTLMAAGIELFVSLVKSLPVVLPELVGAVVTEVIPALVGGVLDAVPRLLRAGGDVIAGLVQGLWNAAGQVGAALVNMIDGAVDGFLSFLGIHSPSRLFRSLGIDIGDGLVSDLDSDSAAAALGLGADSVTGDTVPAELGWAEGTAAALMAVRDGEGAGHASAFEDFSTSSEDKQAKLQRAHLNLERLVVASLGR